jgi:hypothetical protein
MPAAGVKLTPRHYSYLKISEGCNHKCRFCIIPDMRGRLASRPAHAILREAEKLVEAGVKELLVISQDTSAYGVDLKHAEAKGHRAHITDLARDLGTLGAWVRLHYVYPYPHVRDLIPLMADGLVLPYLDIPFQHAHPDTLRRMARPAAAAKTLDEIAAWRPDLPRHHAALHLHRRLPRRDGGGVPDPARLAGGGPTRSCRLLQVRKRRRRPIERAAGSCAGRSEAGPLGPLHADGPGNQRR